MYTSVIKMLKLIVMLCVFNFVKCGNEITLRGKECYNKNVLDHRTNTMRRYDNTCNNEICIIRRCPVNEAFIVLNMNGTNKATCKPLKEINNITKMSIELPSSLYTDLKKKVKSGKKFSALRQVSYNDEVMYSKKCRQSYIYKEQSEDQFPISEDGKIYLGKSFNGDLIKAPGNYIVEFVIKENNKKEWEVRKLVLIFNPTSKPPEGVITFIIVGYGISSVFLALTFVAFIMAKEFTLVNLLIMAHVGCLAVGFAIKSTQMAIFKADLLTKTGCTILCSMWYFAVVASMFWMNVMALDSFWRFWCKIKTPVSNQRRAYRKFLIYGIYAMGMSLLLVIFAITVDKIKFPDHVNIIKPHLDNCFPETTNVYYLSIPIAILLLWNFLLFLLTSFKICWEKRNISKSFTIANSRSVKDDSFNFLLYVKLMIVTGGNWLLDLVELVVPLPDWLIYVFNSNVAIGVAIFIIFVLCDKKAMKRLRRLNTQNTEQSEHSTTKVSTKSTSSIQQPKPTSSTAVTT